MHKISQTILDFNKDRLPGKLAYKYAFMTENMFRFYRGTCHVFYEDLHTSKLIPPSPLSWICGDLHLENFGSYKSNNRLVYFDLNDFDEAVLAPASWEITRMVTSIFIAFSSLKIEEKKAVNMAALFLKTYADVLAKGKAYYIEPQTAKGIVYSFLNAASKRKQKNLLKKRTEEEGKERFLMMDNPKHFEIDPFLKRELCHHMSEWIMYNHDGPYNYEVIDAAFRMAGTGSVGLKRYVFLLRNIKEPQKYIILEMKQAVESSLKKYLRTPQPEWESQADRIVSIQERMQNMSPMLSSTTIFQDDCYIIQEMQSTKDSINFKLIKDRYRDIYQVIYDMALLTASSQLRSSGRQGSASADELIAFGQNKEWQEKILKYALHYTKQVRKDYTDFKADYKKGVFDIKNEAAPLPEQKVKTKKKVAHKKVKAK